MAGIPQWARDRAYKLADEHGHLNNMPCGAIDAFACYIAAHEEPPVDPLLIKAAGIIQNWRNGNAGEDSALDTARLVAAALTKEQS